MHSKANPPSAKQEQQVNSKPLPATPEQQKNRNEVLFTIQPKLTVSAPDDPYEKEADAVADKIMSIPAHNFVQRKCAECEKEEAINRKPLSSFIQKMGSETTNEVSDKVANKITATKGGGSSMDASTKSFMESRFGSNFSNVRIHKGGDAVQLSQQLNARAFTTGNDVYFNSGKYAPESESGKHLLAHELTHTIQQNKRVSKKIQRQPTDLSAYPAIDRQRIQVSWVRVDAAGGLPSLNDSFGTTPATAGGTAVTSNTPSGTVIFNGSVAATPSTTTGYDLRHGLNNIAHFIENTSNILPLNSTITLSLNLIPYGGINGNYRFSFFEHATGTGAAATLQRITLIEQLGAATAVPVVANPTNDAPAGAFTHRGQTFTLGSGWSLQQQAILNQALALVPANGLTQLAGVTFNVGSVSGTEEGHYDEAAHSITIRTSAFGDRLNAYQGGSDAVRIIVHEIAHAIDRRPVRQAWNTYTAGGQTAAGKGALERTRSLSGSSYVFDTAENMHMLEEGAAVTAFRTAVIRDRTQAGVTLPQGITTYSTTNWEENFAEAFAFYMADRTLFQQLRPATFAYFQTNYP